MNAKDETMSSAWAIEAKHPRLWKGWKPLISLYGHTRDQARDHAQRAMRYYEGVNYTRVKPLRLSRVEQTRNAFEKANSVP